VPSVARSSLIMKTEAPKSHWTERGRAASVSISDVADRPRRSVLALAA
jgi:hypothetical protein